MTFANVCNTTAWLLCGVVGFFLLSDFVKTELHITRKQKGQKSEEQKK